MRAAPGLRVPANLYIPSAGDGPFPGVLFQMGHSLNGKAYESYQKCCQALAHLGYVVLAFDPMGQGERTYLHVGDADEEHSRFGRQMLLLGDSATRLQLWDAVRSLDVLASQPMVDPKRLASMGQSGGATLTMLLAAVDDRLTCAVVSSGNTENFACADFNPPGSTDDAEQDFVGSGPLGFDRWDLLYPMAPKPLLIAVSERDSFGTYSPSYIQSGEEEFDKLRRIYEVLGAADRIEWKTTGLPHALTHQMRLYSYEFLERWMHGSNKPVAEPEVKPEPEEQLLVGVHVTRIPMAAPTPGPIDAAGLRSLLRLDSAPLNARVIRMMSDRAEDCDVETIEVESAPGVFLPGYLFVPAPSNRPVVRPRSTAPPLILMLDEGGRTRHWREGGLCHQLAAEGYSVCAFRRSRHRRSAPRSWSRQPRLHRTACARRSLYVGIDDPGAAAAVSTRAGHPRHGPGLPGLGRRPPHRALRQRPHDGASAVRGGARPSHSYRLPRARARLLVEPA